MDSSYRVRAVLLSLFSLAEFALGCVLMSKAQEFPWELESLQYMLYAISGTAILFGMLGVVGATFRRPTMLLFVIIFHVLFLFQCTAWLIVANQEKQYSCSASKSYGGAFESATGWICDVFSKLVTLLALSCAAVLVATILASLCRSRIKRRGAAIIVVTGAPTVINLPMRHVSQPPPQPVQLPAPRQVLCGKCHGSFGTGTFCSSCGVRRA
jgi:hypothetical protein